MILLRHVAYFVVPVAESRIYKTDLRRPRSRVHGRGRLDGPPRSTILGADLSQGQPLKTSQLIIDMIS